MHKTGQTQPSGWAFMIVTFVMLSATLRADAQTEFPGRAARVPPDSGSNYDPRFGASSQPMRPAQFATSDSVIPGAPYLDSQGMLTHRMDDSLYTGERPIEAFVRRAIRQSSFRLDYMLWSIQEPGLHLLGAPTALTSDPQSQFQVADRGTGNNLTLPGIVPSTDNMTLNDVNGIRGILSLPMGDDEFQINAWSLAQASDVVDRLQPTNVYTATTVFTNDQIGSNSTNYDMYSATLTSELWGAGANYIWGQPMAMGPIAWKPLVGFRYLNFQEELNQFGRAVVPDQGNIGEVPSHTVRIHSRTSNNVYGPTAGVQIEFNRPWFSFLLSPRVTLGLNDYSMTVRSQGIVSDTDPVTFQTEEHVDFAAIFQVGAYFQLHINENITAFVGYDVLITANVSRAADNVFYNEDRVSVLGTGLTTQGDVRLHRTITDLVTHGLTIGVVFRLP